MGRLDNRTALITGGTSGIGLGAARRLQEEGARVIITGSRPASVEAALARLGDGAAGLVLDVRDTAAIAALPDRVREHTDRVDVLLPNAGVSMSRPFGSVTEQQFDEIVDVNLKGVYFTVQALLPLLQRGASIVLNGSATAERGIPGSSVYAATKAAMSSLAVNLSAELLDRGIRVNAIAPGAVDTALWDKLNPGADPAVHEQVRAGVTAAVPVGRIASPEEIGALVAYLGSDESAYVVGSTIVIGGGTGTL